VTWTDRRRRLIAATVGIVQVTIGGKPVFTTVVG
jgi:hypothetical protein